MIRTAVRISASAACLSAIVLALSSGVADAQKMSRTQAIQRCVKAVNEFRPSNAESNAAERERTDAYKACMTKLGFRP
jgi:hypothetical protein